MTYESIQPMLDWIGQHPTWAGFVVFLISLSESLAIVGLVVPGVVMMTAIGAMMGGGVLPFWETLTWAILGAIVGDGISYWLGYHFHEHLRDFWPFKQFPKLLARGEAFFKNHGGKSIIFGRFVGPVRPMIPVIAGMMDMPPKRFLFFNIVSAIAWAPLYSLPGILIGVSLGTLSPEVARNIVLLILLLLLVLWIIYAFVLKIAFWIKDLLSRFVRNLWKGFQSSDRFSWVHRALASKQGHEEGQLALVLLSLVSFFAFICITSNVIHSEGLALLNEPVYQALRALYIDKLVSLTALFSGLGAPSVVLPAAFVVGLWLLLKKKYVEMFCWLGTIFVGESIAIILRHIVRMVRPDGILAISSEYAFPSGHMLTSILFYGLGAAFIHHSLNRDSRWIPWAIVLPLIFLIGVSRLYLGMHWFTDIMGSLALGVACVSLGTFFYRRYATRKVNLLTSILIPGLCTLMITYSIFAFHTFPKQRQLLTRQWTTQTISEKNWWAGQGDTNPIYRSGAFKRIATIFDIEWLGSLDNIQTFFINNGFKPAPSITIQTWLTMLISHPKAEQIPVLPKFHRDRLPVLTLIKPLDDKRYVLQVWRSDFIDEQGHELWVGTLRVEEAKHPFPLLTMFLESNPNDQAVNDQALSDLTSNLSHTPNVIYKEIPADESPSRKIILVEDLNGSQRPS